MQNKYELLIIGIALVILALFLVGIIKDAKDSYKKLYENDEPQAKRKKALHHH